MILESGSFGPVETNTYLVGCEETREAVAIDFPLGCLGWLQAEVQQRSLSIKALLLTHSHWDHIADVAAAKKLWPVPLCVHELDAENVRSPGADRLHSPWMIEGAMPDRLLKEGDVISVGALRIQVLHTPGHTPGGVCFYLAQQGVLFSGDTLFAGSIGRLNVATGQPSAMWNSLRKLSTLPQETVVYAGHGEPTTLGDEEWIAYAERRFSGL
jgi:glyoxylase-like metal-dependent hydrolase (beta-lactamase superfamily II)